jgi:hypothetical protein
MLVKKRRKKESRRLQLGLDALYCSLPLFSGQRHISGKEAGMKEEGSKKYYAVYARTHFVTKNWEKNNLSSIQSILDIKEKRTPFIFIFFHISGLECRILRHLASPAF